MSVNTDEICLDPHRRADVRSSKSKTNGIDYIDVAENRTTLTLYFLRTVPENLEKSNVLIQAAPGGRKVRVLELRLCSVDDPDMDDCVFISVDRGGDLGTYTIRLVELDAQGDPTDIPLKGLDPRYAQLDFRFDTGIASEIDCKQQQVCVSQPLPAPDINYLAKDYASFLQLIYDRLALIMPEWSESHVPDEEVALVEILAYVADYLSYYQDAVATEAYLNTARQRISLRRHVRLLDYTLHEGCNARAWITLNSEKQMNLDPTKVQFVAGYQGLAAGPILSQADLAAEPMGSYLVFEPTTTDPIVLYPAHNQIKFYTWGDRQCCLPRGATSATLLDCEGAHPRESQPKAQRPDPDAGRRKKATVAPLQSEKEQQKAPAPPTRILHLKPGDVLLLKEVIGPETGSSDDANPAHQQFVSLTKVTAAFDSLYDPPVPIVEVEWAVEDALTFDLCLSTIGPAAQGCQALDISVASGNVVLADHGSWITSESIGTAPLAAVQQTCQSVSHPADVQIAPGPFQPTLNNYPVTFRQSPAVSRGAASALTQDPRSALPQIKLRSILPLPDGSASWFSPQEFLQRPDLLLTRVTNPQSDADRWLSERLSKQTIALLKAFDPKADDEKKLQDIAKIQQTLANFIRIWTPKPDLLASQAEDCDYVAEIDDSGVAHLRFGDGELGCAVEAGETFFADYRTGNGSDGNLGADGIEYLVLVAPELGAQKANDQKETLASQISKISNPLPAQGGLAPESTDEAKLFAPGTFLNQLERAITAEDYATIAERNPKLQRAAAALLWTGTCYEAHVAIDPLGTDTVEPSLIEEIRDYLYPFRRIGHEVVVVPAQYVPLDLAITVDVLPDYIADHVRAALLNDFSDRVLADGTRGFFHPDNLSFGDDIYVSQLIAGAQSVTGVASVSVTRLERLYAGPNHELENGVLPIGPLEVAQLDNDPTSPERGKLTLTLRGGL